jgi:holo-[acyl-carrier protein] synthase
MATAGLGVDVARIGRFRQMIEAGKGAVIERLFTAGEREYALAKKDPAPHLAARFAAKEAYLKALGTGLRQGMSWQEIEVLRGDLGQPSLRLSGRAAEIFRERGLTGVHLSYSHDGDYAFATVILEGP